MERAIAPVGDFSAADIVFTLETVTQLAKIAAIGLIVSVVTGEFITNLDIA